MENSDLTEAGTTTQQSTSFEQHDPGSSGGEGRPSNLPAVAESTVMHGPRQDSSADTSPPHPADNPGIEDASSTSGENYSPTRVDSATIVHLLLAAAEQISNVSVALPPANAHASPAGDAAKHTAGQGNTEDEDQMEPQHTFQSQRDEVQLVEIRNREGTGWSAMSKAVREYDEEEIGYYKDDIDTLLVFAGLYSAVLSAFIIESYTFLQPETEDKIFFLFQHMLAQNYSMSNGFLNATNPYPTLPDFEAPAWAIRVNVLWFSSLVVSLAAASYGMLVKQWLREYLNTSGTTSPRERLRARQYRRPALDRWKVFQIAASLPLLLKIALGLFFVGLCYFTTAIHSSISRSTIPFVAAWAFFFLVATVAPMVSPRCPFKTTILRAVLRQGRKAVLTLASAGVISYYVLRRANTSISAHATYIAVTNAGRFCYIVLRACDASLREHFLNYARRVIPVSVRSLLSEAHLPHLPVVVTKEEMKSLTADLDAHMKEEQMILEEKQDDIAILQSVEKIMPGDGLLPTLVDVASAANPPWNQAFALMKTIIDNRTGGDTDLGDPSSWHDSLQLLSQQSCDALTTWVSNTISRHRTAREKTLGDEELSECAALFCSLIFSHTRPLTGLREATFHDLIFRMKTNFQPFLFHSYQFKRRVKQLFSGLDADKARMGLTQAEWVTGAENLVLGRDDITDYEGDIYDHDGHWIARALNHLISQWTAPSPQGSPKKHRSSHPLPNLLVEKLLHELCKIGCRGRIYGISAIKVDVFYGILLGGVIKSEQEEWQHPSKLFARNLTRICQLQDDQPYRRGENESLTSPKKAFFTLMKAHSDSWTVTLLSWLLPDRMPGNVLAEIVAADLAACSPEDQRRRLDEIIRICRIASGAEEISLISIGRNINFSSLLQIIILLKRNGVLDGQVSSEKIQPIRNAFGTAVKRKHEIYKALMGNMLDCEDYAQLFGVVRRMRDERLDMIYAMSYGCYRESGWAGIVNQRVRESEMGHIHLRLGRQVPQLRLVVKDVWARKVQVKHLLKNIRKTRPDNSEAVPMLFPALRPPVHIRTTHETEVRVSRTHPGIR